MEDYDIQREILDELRLIRRDIRGVFYILLFGLVSIIGGAVHPTLGKSLFLYGGIVIVVVIIGATIGMTIAKVVNKVKQR